MPSMVLTARITAAGLIVATLIAPPAAAADSTATGVVAGLGLTAASGKSSLSAGGGQIEATLLVNDALAEAGRSIRELVRKSAPDQTVIVLGHSDAVDLSSARWLPVRIDEVKTAAMAMVKGASCSNPSEQVNPNGGAQDRILDFLGTTLKAAPNDVTAAIMTDTSVAGITIAADDRMLVNAITMGDSDPKSQRQQWHSTKALTAWSPAGDTSNFVIPGNVVDVNPEGGVFSKLKSLEEWTNKQRHCTSAEYKAAINYSDTFVTSVTAADKGTPAVVAAAELEGLTKKSTLYVLRVAIESIGGTSVARSNIWYALGYPGAVTISSGLLVSFRLFNAETGANALVGEMRCMLKPANLSDVHRMMVTDPAETVKGKDLPPPEAACAYRLG